MAFRFLKVSIGAALLAGIGFASPATAWETFISDGICTLNHSAADGDLRLTYDPSGPLYGITLTIPEPWPEAPSFGIVFEGPRALAIGTDRHSRSADGRSLTVTDRGFGNVLDGLEFNETATATSGDGAWIVDLAGAAPAVAAFRTCTTQPSA